MHLEVLLKIKVLLNFNRRSLWDMLWRFSLNPAADQQFYKNNAHFKSWVSRWRVFVCTPQSVKAQCVWNFKECMVCLWDSLWILLLQNAFGGQLEVLLFLCLLFWILICSKVESCEILPLQIRDRSASGDFKFYLLLVGLSIWIRPIHFICWVVRNSIKFNRVWAF